ncbi:hypothetical protein [Acidobacterium sp. S8]|uniref:hypothetical protein n=1 Tax=Acidobacterium sp. S8 TaxID=1641854 RepID=UPI00131B022D|nr:hypothetical protein [Acidobacterium sp. S8]
MVVIIDEKPPQRRLNAALIFSNLCGGSKGSLAAVFDQVTAKDRQANPPLSEVAVAEQIRHGITMMSEL